MQRQSRDHFDASSIPDDLAPIATVLSKMLPGNWRSVRPVFSRTKCVKCGLCWLFCPVQCVTEKPRWFDVDLAVCKGCGICAQECPQHAIRMIEEVGR